MIEAPGQPAGDEEALAPEQPIVDAHHHLYDRPGRRYLLDDFAADLRGGHDVRATVHVQARSAYRSSGPPALRPVGETEFACVMAKEAARLPALRTRVNAGIVAHADLLLGGQVKPVLDAHIEAAAGTTASGGRLCGVRHVAAWDTDHGLLNPAYPATEDMLSGSAFRAGFAELAPLGLAFDAWILFPQLPRLTALARAFPDTRLIVDHCGGVVGIGRYAGQSEAVFRQWSTSLRELAACPNVMVKISGLGMALSGFGFDSAPRPPSSLQLAAAWRPWVETCLDAFGTARCMFASNFPADSVSYSYMSGWNAMKRLASSLASDERDDLFWRSASQAYQLPLAL